MVDSWLTILISCKSYYAVMGENVYLPAAPWRLTLGKLSIEFSGHFFVISSNFWGSLLGLFSWLWNVWRLPLSLFALMVISSVSSKASVVFGKEIHCLPISSLYAWNTSLDCWEAPPSIRDFVFIQNVKLWESLTSVLLMIFSCSAVVTWPLLTFSSSNLGFLGSLLAL